MLSAQSSHSVMHKTGRYIIMERPPLPHSYCFSIQWHSILIDLGLEEASTKMQSLGGSGSKAWPAFPHLIQPGSFAVDCL